MTRPKVATVVAAVVIVFGAFASAASAATLRVAVAARFTKGRDLHDQGRRRAATGGADAPSARGMEESAQ